MGAKRIHKNRDPNCGFAAVPDETARDGRMSWAARGYLTEMLTHDEDSWDPETAEQAVRRAKAERGDDAESDRAVRRILAELERHGYRHFVKRPTGKSAWDNHADYYAVPVLSCGDVYCESCKRNRANDSAKVRTRCDQPEQGVSPGGNESALDDYSLGADSSRRQILQETEQETVQPIPGRASDKSGSTRRPRRRIKLTEEERACIAHKALRLLAPVDDSEEEFVWSLSHDYDYEQPIVNIINAQREGRL